MHPTPRTTISLISDIFLLRNQLPKESNKTYEIEFMERLVKPKKGKPMGKFMRRRMKLKDFLNWETARPFPEKMGRMRIL